MNFKSLYSETKENLELALLSLWSPAHHRMRWAMKDLIRREPLFAEPVFQSMFPWKNTTDPNWRSYLAPEVIKIQEDKAMKRGDVYTPFEHQTESWNELKKGNSIVVTSGTGSGKTECFMLPILSDLLSRKSPNGDDPVEAIFLYPLNALMQDQKDRLGCDCQELGLKFAVYNSSLDESKAKRPVNQNYKNAEVITRKAVREFDNKVPSCPQILLTNPSMLEYMLVRDRDQKIFERSQGKLKWIVIDEAHTYTGSAAIELAYLIKRVLSAFDVDRDQVQFVCTSATIGDPTKPQELIDFIETITGKLPASSTKRLVPIDGHRIVPALPAVDVRHELDNNGLNHISESNVLQLRQDINNHPFTLSAIWSALTSLPYNRESCLDLIDKLCNIKIGKDFLMMIKGHFFIRTINGLYTCINEHCHAPIENNSSGFRFLTTEKGNSRCPHCGAPLFELVQCGDCKEFLLVCEENDSHEIRPAYVLGENLNIDEEDNGDEDNDSTDGGMFTDDSWQKVYLAYFGYGRPYTKPHPNYNESKISIIWDGVKFISKVLPNSSWYRLANGNKLYCPNCVNGSGDDGSNFKSFRVPSNWINGVIAPALLAEGKDAINPWGKYIAFTDSRQGTAINAKRFNIDSERAYSRNHLTHDLSDPNNNPQIKALIKLGLPPAAAAAAVAGAGLACGLPEFTLQNIADCIFNQQIFEHIDYDASKNLATSKHQHIKDEEAYKNALLRSHIGRRPVHLASHESLGFITLTYPKINNATLGNEWMRAGFKDEDFRAFLKICIDYHIRMGNHMQPYTPNEIQYIREANRSTPYNPADWPKVQTENGTAIIRQNRLILLLCAGLGITDINSLTSRETEINDLMDEAWQYLAKNILTKVDFNDNYYKELDENGNHKYDGWYYIDLSTNAKVDNVIVKAPEKLWLCPFSYSLMDTIFKGYTPAIKGAVCAENFERFRVPSSAIVDMPIIGTVTFNKNVSDLESRGIWTDRHKYAYQSLSTGGYLTAEHSGQQDRDILEHYTEQFKKTPHQLNLLQCSTTMEMGVDIGDIDTVLMTSVPPTSANYLQRAGRAGRRGQSKAVAISLCPHTSIGVQAFRNPMRNLVTHNPAIKPVESAIIVQRHINSFLVREFVTANNLGFSNVHDWLYKNGFYCDFINWIEVRRTNVALSNAFTSVFGALNLSNSITATQEAIKSIAENYQNTIDNIEQEIQNVKSLRPVNQAKIDALTIQETALCNQELKGYLAEKQFLPNADMPTGVVEFNYIDAYNYTVLNSLRNKLENEKAKLKTTTLVGQQNNIKYNIYDLEREIEALKARTVTSREIKVALSEYAPGQMVVINERNYISAGIEWNNSFGQKQPWNYFYHCPTCGRFEYTDDSTLTTCACGSLYRNILKPNCKPQYTMAIEPIRFRTDVNRGINRQEHTVKTFYQIQTILTNVEWAKSIPGPQCDIIGSDDAQGEIVFYNVGNGEGFNLCLDCGKMEVAKTTRNTTNWPHFDITEKDKKCAVNNVKPGILLSGKFPTSFVSLRFYKDATRTGYVDDVDLLYSLGVILCKALVQIIGVSRDEIDFDVRQEKNYSSIYIYDTSKGGCGYSTELLDISILNATFKKAKDLLTSFTCHCESQERCACVRCLVDRTTQRYEKHLSKYKLLAWFASQTMSTSASKSGLAAIPIPIKLLTTTLYSRTSKSDFVFCADVNNMNALDWTSKDGVMGRIIHECVNRNKKVTILVSNVPNVKNGAKLSDIVPFIDFPSKFPNCTVKAVKSIETSPGVFSALIIDNKAHYYTEDDGVLELNEFWGENCTTLYEDGNIPTFTYESFPTVSDAIALTQPNEITLQATIDTNVKRVIRLNEIYSFVKGFLFKGHDLEEQAVRKILSGKKINIRFSDTYVNSALAALILVYLIKELKETYNFEINEIALQIQGTKRNCSNPKWDDSTWISWSYPYAAMADRYIKKVFEDVLGITPIFSKIEPDHYRWMRFNPVGESNHIEIRPDYGILGGWHSPYIYRELDYITGLSKIETKDNVAAIVYYLIIRK